MNTRSSTSRPLAAVAATLLLLSPALPVFGSSNGPEFLTGPQEGDPLQIVLSYVQSNLDTLGLTAADLDGVRTEHYDSSVSGVTHVRLIQGHAGIDVDQGDILANVAADGSIINLHNRFTADLAAQVGSAEPSLSAVEAVEQAAYGLGLAITESLVLLEEDTDASRGSLVSQGGISRRPIPARLVWTTDRGIRLAWDLSILETARDHWWSLRVDAATGEVIDRVDWTVHDNFSVSGTTSSDPVELAPPGSFKLFGVNEGYLVYEWPVESPLHNPTGTPGPPVEGRSIQIQPANSASPFGWHDTNGTPGPEYTYTRGNNVWANKSGGTFPDCGPSLDCTSSPDFDLNLSIEPTVGSNVSAAIVNLFYWNNIVHDVWYLYGFDEVAGNFQENNYGNGGLGSDSVDARAQAPGNCNANFSTPADGDNPLMNMFTCNIATPSRDGDLDNGVIAHEYGHGISTRITGGPANVGCLDNNEQMGEGWSDWFGLVMTIESGDLGTDTRPIGTYLLGQAPNGPGVRTQPYSTNMAVNNLTYGDIGGMAIPHGVGEVWAAMLWDLTWALVDNGVTQSGLDLDIYNGTGGNNLAMQLVIDGMKLQPCLPGFVDGRDAILLADLNNNGGANQCVIWEAFARRGLGFSADQGSSNSTSDGTEAFDLPDACLNILKITKTATPDPAIPGSTIQYELTVTNDKPEPLTGVVVVDPIPANTTFVPGSATCGGQLVVDEVVFDLGDMPSGASTSCTFEVTVDAGVQTVVLFQDDLESGFANWTPTGLWNMENEADTCGSSVAPFPSPTNAAYYGNDSQCNFDTGGSNSGELTLTTPIDVIGNAPILSLWSYEDTEDDTTFDKKEVQISTDGGGTWSTLAEMSNEGVWYERELDLSPYIGMSILLRFRFEATDGIANSDLGWLVDDILVVDPASIANTACVSAVEGDQACGSVVTPIQPSFSLEVSPEQVDVCAGSDAIFTVDVTSLGITDPVTLSAVSNPPGATMTFATNPVIPTAGTTLTVSAPATAYSIEVSGSGGGVNAGDTASLTLTPVVGAIGLVAPADGSNNMTVQPSFEWTADAAATSYLFELATDAGFANIVHSATVGTTTYHPAMNLSGSTTFFWRVTPANTCGPGSSPVFSFTTVGMLCSAPGLAIPDDDVLGVSDTINLTGEGTITDLDVVIDVSHTWVGDLIFTLTHESGTSVVLVDRPGVPATTVGCGGDNIALILDDDGSEPVEDFCSDQPALFGSLIPNEALAGFNGGLISGDWTLTVSDNFAQDTGTLDSWCLIPTVLLPPDLFADGFESGDMSAWSSSAP